MKNRTEEVEKAIRSMQKFAEDLGIAFAKTGEFIQKERMKEYQRGCHHFYNGACISSRCYCRSQFKAEQKERAMKDEEKNTEQPLITEDMLAEPLDYKGTSGIEDLQKTYEMGYADARAEADEEQFRLMKSLSECQMKGLVRESRREQAIAMLERVIETKNPSEDNLREIIHRLKY